MTSSLPDCDNLHVFFDSGCLNLLPVPPPLCGSFASDEFIRLSCRNDSLPIGVGRDSSMAPEWTVSKAVFECEIIRWTLGDRARKLRRLLLLWRRIDGGGNFGNGGRVDFALEIDSDDSTIAALKQVLDAAVLSSGRLLLPLQLQLLEFVVSTLLLELRRS